MVWKPYQCRRCGQHKIARSPDEAGKLMRVACARQEPRHEPAPVHELERQALLEVE